MVYDPEKVGKINEELKRPEVQNALTKAINKLQEGDGAMEAGVRSAIAIIIC